AGNGGPRAPTPRGRARVAAPRLPPGLWGERGGKNSPPPPADHHPSAKPWPWQQHRLDRAIDNVGTGIERGADLRDIAAVLRESLAQEPRVILASEYRIRCLRTDVKEIHEIVAERHGAGFPPDALQKFQRLHVVRRWALPPPGAVARRPRHEGGADKIRAGSRAYTVEAGDEIEGFGAAVREFRDDAPAFVAHFLHHGA